MKTQIYVTTQFVGFHRWEDAPNEVAFLRQTHRHVFHVKATYNVKHNDRDLEFFIMQRRVEEEMERYAQDHKDNLGSCEMMAAYLVERSLFVQLDVFSVEVSEDGENGAIVYADAPSRM